MVINKRFAIEHGPFSSLVYPFNIVIFHSYVSLPEGKSLLQTSTNNYARAFPLTGS